MDETLTGEQLAAGVSAVLFGLLFLFFICGILAPEEDSDNGYDEF